ncbi:hypothetical protein DFH09DRAFT_1068305 [Mycena vulgaris]|nr:hypothetical protein DFH09DRAFT_1068305 [Mycena vulgaris]
MSEPGSSRDSWALRSELLRQWAVDCNHLATIQRELETARTENVALKVELEARSADAETRKNDAALLEAELARREATIAAQNIMIKRLQTSSERDWQLANIFRADLKDVNDQLNEQEHDAQAKILQAENSSLKAKALRIKSPSKSLPQSLPQYARATAAVTPHEPQETAGTPPPTRANDDAVAEAAPVASTSRGQYTTSVVVKPEVKDEDFSLVDPVLPPTYLTPLPEYRRKELQPFPEFVHDDEDAAVFSRKFLRANLGGNDQQLIINITASQKPLAKEHNISKFLCPNLKMNPWCPTSPGRHGYMFVGLGRESETFQEPEQLNLFLSVPSTGGNRNLQVSYLGLYEACRVPALTVAEWRTLAPAVQISYTKLTKERETRISAKEKAKDLAKIRAAYDSGSISVPCVRLRWIGFDEPLYADLSAASLKRARESDSGSPDPKRRRTGGIL